MSKRQLSKTVSTGMQGGDYINIIDGSRVSVAADGTATININNQGKPELSFTRLNNCIIVVHIHDFKRAFLQSVLDVMEQTQDLHLDPQQQLQWVVKQPLRNLVICQELLSLLRSKPAVDRMCSSEEVCHPVTTFPLL